MSGAQAEAYLDADDLLRPMDNGLVRVPLLIRGQLVPPPAVSADDARALLSASDGVGRAAGGNGRSGFQVVAEMGVDRARMRSNGDLRLLVMPDVSAGNILFPDPGGTREALASVPFADAVSWLDDAGAALRPDAALGRRLRALVAATSLLPDLLLDAALATNAAMLSASAVTEVVNRELSHGGVNGARFLDEWITMDAPGWDGATAQARATVAGHRPDVSPPTVRALPTLQIHITAGNAPVVATTSALRALATRSGSVVKLPSGAILPGAFLAAALAHAPAGTAAPLLASTSLVYWKGGDARVEEPLFDPRVFDRVVVWGAPDAVERIGALSAASAIRTVTFQPRFGISLLGESSVRDDEQLQATARLAAADVIIWNQQACIASLVHYVEGTEETAGRYASALRDALAAYQEVAPSSPTPDALGRIRRLRRGKWVHADWSAVGDPDDLRAAVVHVPGPFELGEHPLSRVVLVRAVPSLDDAVALCSRAVSTAGVAPEARRLVLRNGLAARGVSNVLPLGLCERAYAGMPHDGMRVLSELVEWVNA